jgi:hypothetical protein
MKAEILKIAGVKSEKEFYKKFPTEESFIKVHGKALKKAQMGAMIQGNQPPQTNPRPINFQQLYDQNDMFITGSTQDMREQEALQLADLQAQQKMSKKGSGIVDAIGQIGKIAGGMSDGAKNGKKLKKALFGDETLPMGKPGMGDMFGKIGKGISAGVGKAGGPMAVAQAAGDIVGGIQQMRDEKQTMKQSQQMAGVSDVALQASQTRPEQVPRRYVRPEDNVNTGQEFFPIYGTGTVLAKNGTEIANTFAPNTIYTDLEEAKNGMSFGNQDFLKGTGISNFAQQGGGDAISQLTAGLGSPKGQGVSGGGRVGAGIGSVAGTLLGGPVGGMIGKFAGQTLGNVLDRKAEKTEAFNERTQGNIETMAFNQGTQGLQAQNASYMRDGGMANPQIINQFGNYKLSQLLQPDPTMDTLRAGGHLKNYTPPSERAIYTGREQFAMGGDLETHWGGYAEPMSYNPYLPEGGETVMFRGKSHDESDGKGNTGIGITYGDSPVEVERGEPAVQLRNGSDGDNSLTVYGNLMIPSFGASLIGDEKAKGRKFKNYVADLSKIEQKQNKIVEKSTDKLDDLEVNTPQDLLAFESYKANMLGANMKLKDIAKKKQDLASLQSAINDTAEEYGFEADALAKGKVKQAKKGASIDKAQRGKNLKKLRETIANQMNALEPMYTEPFADTTDPMDKYMDLDEAVVTDSRIVDEERKGPTLEELRNRQLTFGNYPNFKYTPKEKGEFDWMTIANQILPYLRPTDAEPLDPRQLSGEMLALAQNQLEPVQAQTFQPQLNVPYDISLQDIVNENEADYRAAQRMIGYNPAALAALNAQKYQANQKVLGEQFRLNQSMRDKVFAENRAFLNQTGVQNLGILDQQYGRQQEALSKTKATAQAALNSISAKYLQNQAENRTLQTYENLYNYRFDPRFRAQNMNALAQFAPQGSGMGGASPYGSMTSDQMEIMALQKKLEEKQQKLAQDSKAKVSKNGALVKAIKSM